MANEIINKKSKNLRLSVKKTTVIVKEKNRKFLMIWFVINSQTFESLELRYIFQKLTQKKNKRLLETLRLIRLLITILKIYVVM